MLVVGSERQTAASSAKEDLIVDSFQSTHVMSHEFHCAFEKKKMTFFLCC